MKLKLLKIGILVVLALVGYQTYTKYSTLNSIDSYESCVGSEGSRIQESNPPTCVTRLSTRFIKSVIPYNSPLPIPTISPSSSASGKIIENLKSNLNTYVNEVNKIEFQYPKKYALYDDFYEKNGDIGFLMLQEKSEYPRLPVFWISICKPSLPQYGCGSEVYNSNFSKLVVNSEVWNMNIGGKVVVSEYADFSVSYRRYDDRNIDGHIFKTFEQFDERDGANISDQNVRINLNLENDKLTMFGTYLNYNSLEFYNQILSTFKFID